MCKLLLDQISFTNESHKTAQIYFNHILHTTNFELKHRSLSQAFELSEVKASLLSPQKAARTALNYIPLEAFKLLK